ncbi:MAG TPA: hypothetical protein VGV60_01270 [Candidatus Polarisedimenticolia bacterium]|nr:hypothetical protein [Candidatus Polarisedimenticolia bacterium]
MKFKNFMKGAIESPTPAPAGYIPFSADRMPTRKQVEAALAEREPCPQELGLADVCDCRNHYGEPIHGFREYGQGMGRLTGDGSNIFPPGSASAMQHVDVQHVNAQIVAAVEAAREAQDRIDEREAAAANAPMALAEAEQALADEMQRLREEAGG